MDDISSGAVPPFPATPRAVSLFAASCSHPPPPGSGQPVRDGEVEGTKRVRAQSETTYIQTRANELVTSKGSVKQSSGKGVLQQQQKE